MQLDKVKGYEWPTGREMRFLKCCVISTDVMSMDTAQRMCLILSQYTKVNIYIYISESVGIHKEILLQLEFAMFCMTCVSQGHEPGLQA